MQPVDHTIQDLRRVISKGGAEAEQARDLVRQLEAARARDGELSRRIEDAQRRLNAFSDPSPSRGPGPTETPMPRGNEGGGGAVAPPAFTAGQRITAVAVLAAMAANAAVNKIISHLNERDIKDALKRSEDLFQGEQTTNPSLGFLFVFRFTGGADSGEGPTAEARFQGVTWERGRNEAEARASSRTPTPVRRTSTPGFRRWRRSLSGRPWAWPSSLTSRKWSSSALSSRKSAASRWRTYAARLSEDGQKWALGLRFHVLRPPATISYRGVRGGSETESLTIEERDVIDGRVSAIIIDGVLGRACMIAADQQTLAFFRAELAFRSTTAAS